MISALPRSGYVIGLSPLLHVRRPVGCHAALPAAACVIGAQPEGGQRRLQGMGTIKRGPFGHHALAVAITALGLAALAACQPSPVPPAPGHSAGSALGREVPGAEASRAATPAAEPATTPAGPAGAVAGRPGGYGRARLNVLSATFVSAGTGWALGTRPCRRHGCRLELRKTTDHGRHWFPVPAPPAPYAAPGRTPAPDGVNSVAFANTGDGWAFGPGLWATHNGGRTWHQVSLHGWPVQSLAAGGGQVIAVVTRCLSGTQRCGRFRVYTAPVTRDRWQPVPGADGTTGVIGGGTAAPEVTVAAGTGFVTAPAPVYGPANAQPTLLTGPADGSARWHPLVPPCPAWPAIHLAATPGLGLAVGCASEPGAGEQTKRAYFSADGGGWRRLADPPLNGYLDTISITPAGTMLVSGGRSDVYVSWDGGQSWHGTASTSPSMERAYQGGESLAAAMTTDTQGFTLEPGSGSGQIWFTYDDAHTWHLVTLY